MLPELTELQSDMIISLYLRLNTTGNQYKATELEDASLRKQIISEALDALKKDYPTATEDDVRASIKHIGAKL